MITGFSAQLETVNAFELVRDIVKTSGIVSRTYADNSPESMSRRENIQELLNAIHEFCEAKIENEESALLVDFLAEVSLLTDQDTDEDTEEEKITMMTVHAAKGLEFKVVFVVGMEEELFPSTYSTDSIRELEEERRLFYVAITRAEERCYITYAKSRFKNGQMSFSNPSRFIKDIDPVYLDFPLNLQSESQASFFDTKVQTRGRSFQSYPSRKPKTYKPRQSVDYSSNTAGLELGTANLRRLDKLDSTSESDLNHTPSIPLGKFVKHEKFGIGKVLSISLSGANEKAEIDFGEQGTKTLLLKFARLEVLD